MICANCGKQLAEGIVLFCPPCWWKIPGGDRAAINGMYRRKQPLEAKIASVVRKLKS